MPLHVVENDYLMQRISVKIVLEEGADKDHLLRIGMSVEPTVIAK